MELPEPPWRVLAAAPGNPRIPRWHTYSHFDNWNHIFDGAHEERAQDLLIIKHPRNDPEAVEIIERARRLAAASQPEK